MKYLVVETLNGEMWRDVALFDDINDAAKFIESCAWATDIDQQLADPVIDIVFDDYDIPDFVKQRYEKRFRKPWGKF